MTEHIHQPTDPRIFVFGSNRKGIHGRGGARYARDHLGARRGVGEGPMGRCYALPTCSGPGIALPIDDVFKAVERFFDYAKQHPTERFFVSAIGCGNAGFKEDEIAPMFSLAPQNCDLPPGWRT